MRSLISAFPFLPPPVALVTGEALPLDRHARCAIGHALGAGGPVVDLPHLRRLLLCRYGSGTGAPPQPQLSVLAPLWRDELRQVVLGRLTPQSALQQCLQSLETAWCVDPQVQAGCDAVVTHAQQPAAALDYATLQQVWSSVVPPGAVRLDGHEAVRHACQSLFFLLRKPPLPPPEPATVLTQAAPTAKTQVQVCGHDDGSTSVRKSVPPGQQAHDDPRTGPELRLERSWRLQQRVLTTTSEKSGQPTWHAGLSCQHRLERAFDEGTDNLDMEHAQGPDGDDLAQGLKSASQDGAISRDEARIAILFLARRLFQALAFLHATGHAHSDVKPDNIALRGDGELLLLDFEGGNAFGAPATAMTPRFAPPEFTQPPPGTPRTAAAAADVYSAGMTLRDMFYSLHGDDEGPRREVQHLVRRATAMEPQERPSAAALLLHPALLAHPGDDAIARDILCRAMDHMRQRNTDWHGGPCGHWNDHVPRAWDAVHAVLPAFEQALIEAGTSIAHVKQAGQQLSRDLQPMRDRIASLDGPRQPDVERCDAQAESYLRRLVDLGTQADALVETFERDRRRHPDACKQQIERYREQADEVLGRPQLSLSRHDLNASIGTALAEVVLDDAACRAMLKALANTKPG